MATAKKAAGKAAAKQTKASDVDDILGEGGSAPAGESSGGDDVLEGKSAKKSGGGKGAAAKGGAAKKGSGKKAEAAPAKKASAKKEGTGGGRTGTTEAVRKALSATRKLSTYNDVAEAGGFDLRLVRRTARAMDEEGVLERVKEGTVIYVKAKKAA